MFETNSSYLSVENIWSWSAILSYLLVSTTSWYDCILM